MTPTVVPVPPGSRILDMYSPPSLVTMRTFKANGYNGLALYPETITPQHVENAMATGLGLFFVRSCRKGGWLPTAIMGSDDGLGEAARVKSLGGLPGVTVFCDDEGPGGDAASEIAYLNAFFAAVLSEHFGDGAYEGAGTHLTPDEWYRELTTGTYWHSVSSSVPPVPVRGYCLIQEPPPDRIICGHEVDVSVAQLDMLGECRVKWMIDGDSLAAA